MYLSLGCPSNCFLVHRRILMTADPAEDLHAFQHLLLEIWTRDVLARESPVRGVKFVRLDGFPDAVDLGRWKRDHFVRQRSSLENQRC